MSDLPPRAAAALTFNERFHLAASLLPPFALIWLASRHGWVPLPPPLCLAAMPVVLVIGLLIPRAFTGWHRVFNRGQRWLGGYLLTALLGLAFIVGILPVGLWLKFRGRSFLAPPPGDSYWVPVTPPGSLKDQY